MNDETFWAHPAALVESADIGRGTRIWAFAHVMKGARVGADCNVGGGAFVESGTVVGDRVTIKNGVLLWDGVTVEDDVFLGPGVVFTNDLLPRSPRFEGAVARYRDKNWLVGTTVRRGASIGANATVRCGITVGAFAMVGAGAVVSRSVPDYGLVLGVPAKQVGWVSEIGERLKFDTGGTAICPLSEKEYRLDKGIVSPVSH